jgi:hypothetical protein
MKGRIFTVRELDKMLPLVEPISRDISASYRRVTAALNEHEVLKKRLGVEHELTQAADELVGTCLCELQEFVREIEELGGVVKDYENGFIDFYGDVKGEIVYLCWKPGEKRIEFFHGLEEGMARRRPFQIAGVP